MRDLGMKIFCGQWRQPGLDTKLKMSPEVNNNNLNDTYISMQLYVAALSKMCVWWFFSKESLLCLQLNRILRWIMVESINDRQCVGASCRDVHAVPPRHMVSLFLAIFQNEGPWVGMTSKLLCQKSEQLELIQTKEHCPPSVKVLRSCNVVIVAWLRTLKTWLLER